MTFFFLCQPNLPNDVFCSCICFISELACNVFWYICLCWAFEGELFEILKAASIYCYTILIGIFEFFPLSNNQIPRTITQKLLSTVPPAESSMFRVDFRSTHVQYLNNLEEDAMYKRWRSNINEVGLLFSLCFRS